MNLRARFTVFATLWIMFILLVFDIFIYYYFINVSSKNELNLMQDKAYTILKVEGIVEEEQWKNPNLLSEFLVAGEMIRIIGIDGEIKNQIYSDEDLLEKSSITLKKQNSQIIRNGSLRYIYIQLPIVNHAHVKVGTLEIGHTLVRLQYFLGLLLNALIVASLCAVLLSLIGGYFYTTLLIRPIYSFVKTMRDIQKSGEFRSIELPNNRQDELSILANAFNSMMERIKQNFSRQKQFVADASHELKTPLTIIESYTSLLQRWGWNDKQIREEAVEAIHNEAIRLKELTKSLLQLADLEADEWVSRERTDMIQLAKETSAMMEQAFGRRIQIKSEDTEIIIKADVAKVKQVFIILLDNAIKYSFLPILMEIQEHNKYCKVKIIDRGIGIEPDEIPHLFERFYRVDKARARTTGGVGLGLSIAKRIIELHGGYIEVYSVINKGTTMVINFPKM